MTTMTERNLATIRSALLHRKAEIRGIDPLGPDLIWRHEVIAAIDHALAALSYLETRLDALQQWEPLPDGTYEASLGPIHIITNAGLKKETLLKDEDDVMILPGYIRLCRRVTPGEEP